MSDCIPGGRKLARDLFSDITQLTLTRTLDATVARQKSIANNIANVETPGYKRVFVSFENELRSALEEPIASSRKSLLQNLTPVRKTDYVSPSKPDGNNVNIDAEMSDLAKNQLQNKAATTLMQAKLSIMRAAISEGKK